MKKEKSIGVFDSGLGGLSNVKELLNLLPNENIIYFGDTGRVPYGTRSNDIILKYTRQDLRFLQSFDLKLVIVACGTVSSVALDTVKNETNVPIIGVVEPTVKKAVLSTKNKRIGIIGTEGTIKSGSYRNKIKAMDPEIEIFENPCPLFVPLVENGHLNSEATRIIATEYLTPIKEQGVDTLILGCTHYPLLSGIIGDIMEKEVSLINPGLETAIHAKEFLTSNHQLNNDPNGSVRYFVSDDVDKFSYLASMFLNNEIRQQVQKIDIEEW